MRFPLKVLVLLPTLFVPCGFSQVGVLGQKQPDGQFRFEAVEELQIEGSHRVRLLPASARQVTPEEARRLAREELTQIGMIRMDSARRLVRLNDAGAPADTLLPDSFAPKTAVDAASAQGRLTIQAFPNKRLKTGDTIPWEQFFVFLPGPDPDRLALDLVTQSSFFADLPEQFAAMAGFAVSFPDSPLQADLSFQLQDRISRGVAAFENHGSHTDLLQTRRFAELAVRTFPADAALSRLFQQIGGLIDNVESMRLKIASLAAGGEWELLLDAYRPFELYQWSFPDTIALRQTALEESARLHTHRASLLAERQLHAEALREFALAARCDPDNPQTARLIEAERLASSRGDGGTAARQDLPDDLEKKRTALRQQLEKLRQDGDYPALRTAAGQALALDPGEESFLYYGGVTAALFGEQAAARERLDRYLTKSNSLRGDLEMRGRALRIRALLDRAPAPAAASAGIPNWLSGKLLAEGVYYDPASAAFQIPIDSVVGYKLKMAFLWDQNRLTAISSSFDDEKGVQNYRGLSGAPDAQGNFLFGYGAKDPQLEVASTKALDGSPAQAGWRVARDAANPPHLVDDHGLPRILLQDTSQFNLPVLRILEGDLSTGIAGNAYFNPFIWDGLHYFSLEYDTKGRLAAAREWNADNLLRFTWSGDRLVQIRAFRKESSISYYQRTISYSGAMIAGESYAAGSKTGQIKYVYSGKVLQQVKVEDGGVHDGKTWTVRMR